MGAARASTVGRMSLALSLLSEVQTACTMSCGTMGFAFLTASLGTIPPFFSLFFTFFTSHHTAFTHPVGGGSPQRIKDGHYVSIHDMAVETAQYAYGYFCFSSSSFLPLTASYLFASRPKSILIEFTAGFMYCLSSWQLYPQSPRDSTWRLLPSFRLRRRRRPQPEAPS